jgi:hypothetical protein
MGSERADFYATLDLKAVEASLKQARAEIDATITANGRLDASLGRVEGAVGKMRKGMGPAVGAMNGLTAAMGETTGAMGKVLAGGGQLANAWAAGGPMMAAIAGLGVGLAMLQKHWDEVNKAQDEAIAKEFAVTDKASKMLTDLRKQVGKEREQLAIATSTGDDRSMVEFALSFREQMVAANALMENTDAHIRSIGKGARKQIDELIALRAETMKIAKATADKTKTPKKGEPDWLLEGPAGLPSDSEFDKAMDERYAKERAADQMERDLREKADADGLKALRDHEKDVLAAKKVGAQAADALRMEEIQKEQDNLEMIRKGYQDLYTDWMPGALNNGLGAFQGFIDGVIEGDEYAAQKATAAFMKSTGNQLVGIGTKALFEGAVMNTAVPGSGIPMMAVGGLAIAAGVGMGAGSTAISVGVGKAETRDEERKQAAEDRAKEREKAAKERGTGGRSARGSGGSSGGGGVTIVNQWGVAGPTADEQARAMRRVVDRMNDGRF